MKDLKTYFNINKDKVYLKLSVLFFVIWLFFKGPLRSFVGTDDFIIKTFLGSAPNLFAGMTLVFWQTYITNSKPLLAFLCAIVILFSGEFIQLFMDTQTADYLDLIASFIGCSIATYSVLFIEKRKLQ